MRKRYNIMADPKKMYQISRYANELGFSRSFIIDLAFELFIISNRLDYDPCDSKIKGQIEFDSGEEVS